MLWGCADLTVKSNSCGVVYFSCLRGRSYLSPDVRSMFLVLLMPWHAAMTKNKSLSVFLILLMLWYAAVWLRMGYVSVCSFATNVSLCRARFSWYSREHLNSVHLRSMDCPLIERMSTAHRSLLLPPSQGLNRTVRHCRSVSYLLDVASLASSRRDASSFTNLSRAVSRCMGAAIICLGWLSLVILYWVVSRFWN